jgi:protein SCO1
VIARRAFLVAACALAGCDRLLGKPGSPFKAIDVTGSSQVGGELGLTDHHGKPRTLADFRGKVVIVNFGYTSCPDVCPTTLAEFASAMRRLGDDAARVQVLFVTVDPKRDTPELLAQYVPAFHPAFLGLRGDDAATARVTKSFGVYSSIQEGKTPETYTVSHSGQSFVFDPQGRLRLVVPPGLPPESLASDLRLLLNA